jgi:ABC-2 type transport system permease protein
MKKFWLVLSFEYARQVFRKRFLFGLLSVPAIILVMIVVIWITLAAETNTKPVGYIDHSGFLSNPAPPPPVAPPEKTVEFISYQSEADALAALKSGELQAYYVLGADYLETGQAQRVSMRQPSSLAESQFKNYLRANLLANLPGPVRERLTQGNHMVFRSADGGRQMDEENWINILIPFFTGLALMIAIFASSGYLMQAVVDEKVNRTIEILATSLSPTQLISGKALAMIGLGLTQIAAWIGFGLAVLSLARRGQAIAQTIQISPWSLAPILLVFLPSFVTIAGLMIIVGSTVADEREGQQIASLLTLPVVLPYALAIPLMTNPNSPIALALSFFPLTAPVAVTLRMAFNPLPAGQLALIIAVLSLWALASILLAGRAFRLGLLSYGKRLSLRFLFRRRKPAGVAS